MRYFSMFSGIGGFELGIGDRGECVGYSEIDKYAISVYERNFDGHKNYGDATAIDPGRLPDFDLLVGGFPCQAFSIAGKRHGFNETRGTLFFDIARILADKRPRHLVLENVKGLLTHDGGKTFQTILGVLADLGYRVEWQVLNSKDFGVPQNRERVYIVGHLGDGCGRQVFPIGQGDTDAIESGSGRQRVLANTLDSNYYKGADGKRTILKVKSATKLGYEEATIGDGINLGAPNSSTRRARVADQQANTLDTAGAIGTFDGSRIRRLTPRECERLQGFPDDWTAYGRAWTELPGNYRRKTEAPISDTQRYKMCGNAVTVNVVEAVITALSESCYC